MWILKNGACIASTAEQTETEFADSYEETVIALIRLKYSLEEELAIQRQRDTKPEEFQEYVTYCEEWKAKAKTQA